MAVSSLTRYVLPAVGNTSDQARTFLQGRLRLFAGLSGLVSLGFLILSPAIELMLSPGSQLLAYMHSQAFLFHFLATLLLLGNWALLRAKPFGARALLIDDAVFTVAGATLLALMGSAIPNRYGYIQALLAVSFTIHVRAVMVPSSGRRTFGISSASSVLSVLALTMIARGLVPRDSHEPPITALEIILNMGLWLLASTAVATVSSRIIFGLREEVKAARQIGQYVLESKLGEGGMGVVYLATHALLRRKTALKMLLADRVDPQTLARFEREVRQLARLTHPNTVAIYDYGRTPEGTFYFAMEYLQGLGLDDLVHAIGPLPPERVVHLLDQICGSLIEAHAMGLIHRDIKPANVIVCEQGGVPDVVKVLDFGLVKDTHNPHEAELTANASFLGTPLYASPEAVKGGDITAASDMYAVSAVGYYLLTGTDVFGGSTIMEIGAGHLYKEVEAPSHRLGKPLPAALDRLILQGLSKDPAARPRDARSFRQALARCGVSPWPEEDAVAWWQSQGRELVRRRVANANAPAHAALAVSLAGRQSLV